MQEGSRYISIVTTFLLSFTSIVDVIKTESSPTIGTAASSFATCSLWTLPLAQDLAFIAPLFFSFRKISDDGAFFLSSSDRSFACFSSIFVELVQLFSHRRFPLFSESLNTHFQLVLPSLGHTSSSFSS